MDDELADDDHDEATDIADFKPARFSSDLRLPAGDEQQLNDAAVAVRHEFRDSSRWKRLNCMKVSVFAERDRGMVYVVHIGKTVEFDWTWEGAKAFCPNSLDENDSFSDRFYEEAEYEDAIDWSGEIVEVDEQHGCLFVALDDPEAIPKAGAFFVRPFEFLSVLHAIYNSDTFEKVRERLPARLNASRGGVHPGISHTAMVGLSHLKSWWQHSWSVLWGPPGTGKTWTSGQQIARVLSDKRERILILSTTNKATDAVALSLGEAVKSVCPVELENETLRRIGKGASYQTFVNRELDSMLAGAESDVLSKIDGLAQQLPLFDSWEEKAFTRKQISELRSTGNDRSNRIFVDPENRVVIATAFKAMSFLKDDTIRQMVEDGEAPFTTIFIDEAGLISRSAIAALSLLAARRVVLVGDSKQLAPISRISRVLPTRQQTWLASSGLSHLEETRDVPTAVHLLCEQRRMHPEVCKVVSTFQYNGVLKTAMERARQESSLSPFLSDWSRTIWYVLDEEDCDLAAIRATRGPGNKSWIRQITKSVLQKLFSDSDVRRANGLFISPFKAQANAIGESLADWRMHSWESSTVHSQQGSETDIVVFDTVNAGSHTWGVVEWKRLVNVALSRAREAVVVLASRAEMDEPYLRPLKRQLSPSVLVREGGRYKWSQPADRASMESSLVAEQKASYQNRSRTPESYTEKSGQPNCRMGDQIDARKGMKRLFSQEQTRLTNLKLDGKPRLVRGVAGSGKSVVLCNWLAKTAKRLRGKTDARIWAVYANRSLHKLLCDSIEAAWEHQSDGELLDRSSFPWENVELLHVKDVLSGMLPSVQMTMDQFGFDYDRAAEEFLNQQDTENLLPRCTALFIDEAQDMGPSTLRLLLSVVEQSDKADANSRSAHIFYDNAQNVYDTKTPKWAEFGLDMRGRSTIMRESFRATRQITELAVNVLHRLSGDTGRDDQQELISLGLLKPTTRNGEDWLEATFSQIEGPKPIFHSFDHRSDEMAAIAKHLRHLIEVEGISPIDICVIYNGSAVRILESQLAPKLAQFGVELSFQKNRSFERIENTLIATTPHSYKGYEAEVVVVPCVDHYVAREGKLVANALYVAMTRARSLLAIYGISGVSEASRKVVGTIADCVRSQNAQPKVDVSDD
ncbi:AAA family ATPase [Roseiconus nitratireducens]|uniref:AAA family ATPase n=1 Tax=Roseiconus nitratireducens TaxID=2605748 RepID=A0A5M6DG55_9BACT|nr:AAA domain-containing protein [Roseiconus nitratireducens]KAA5545396.1 AAA family ATPase [Roseiconus nitratireducens]